MNIDEKIILGGELIIAILIKLELSRKDIGLVLEGVRETIPDEIE